MISSDTYQSVQRQIFFSKADIPFLNPQPQGIAISPEAIITVCQHVFQKNPASVEKLPRSSLHEVYRIRIDKDLYILRINILSSEYTTYPLITEERILRISATHKLPVPGIMIADVSRKVVTFDYQILSYIEGTSLYDLSDRKELNNYIFQLGTLIAHLHRIPSTNYGPWKISSASSTLEGIYQSWNTYLFCNLKKHLDYCRTQRIIESSQEKIIKTLFERYRSRERISVVPSILHGDIAHHNVIGHNGQIAGLIDWEDSISGDPIFDIAFYATGAYTHPSWLENFFKGYERVRTIKNEPHFEHRYWIYFLRISLAKAVILHHQIKKQKKGVPSCTERIEYAIESLQKNSFS